MTQVDRPNDIGSENFYYFYFFLNSRRLTVAIFKNKKIVISQKLFD